MIINNIKKVKIYKYGYQSKNKNIIKINANENPFSPSLKIIKNLFKEIKYLGNLLKYYPDPESLNIKITISKYYGVKYKEIFLGNGSDEVLAHAFMTFFKSKKFLYIQNITYCFYESYIKLYKIKYIILNLNKKFSIKKKYLKNTKGNFLITNPNAPTGKIFYKKEIEKILIHNKKSLILIDETYIDFSESKSLINMIKKYKNLLICQTLSKSRSLAGIRLGVIIGNEIFINNLEIIKNSFNTYPIDILSQKIITSLYKNNINFLKKIRKIKNNKKFLIKNLKKLKFKIIDSESNFLLIKNKNINMHFLTKNLKKKNIFIRQFDIPLLENFSRISVSNKINCKFLIKNIKIILSLNKSFK